MAKSLFVALATLAMKSFTEETEKPTAAKAQKHLEKHLAFPATVEKDENVPGGFYVTVGKGKNAESFSVKPKVVKASPKVDSSTEDSADDK